MRGFDSLPDLIYYIMAGKEQNIGYKRIVQTEAVVGVAAAIVLLESPVLASIAIAAFIGYRLKGWAEKRKVKREAVK